MATVREAQHDEGMAQQPTPQDMVRAYFEAYPDTLPALRPQATLMIDASGAIMDADTRQLDQTIRHNPAMCAELLRLSNSPLYRRGSEVTSITDAIVRLGRQQVYGIAVSMASRALFQNSRQNLDALCPQLWRLSQNHCVVCAFATAHIVSTLRLAAYETGFLAGMFSFIGQTFCLRALGHLSLRQQLSFGPQQPAYLATARQMCGELSSKALYLWDVPQTLQKTCDAVHSSEEPAAPQRAVALATRLAHWIELLQTDTSGDREALQSALQSTCDALDLSGAVLRRLRQRIAQLHEHALASH